MWLRGARKNLTLLLGCFPLILQKWGRLLLFASHLDPETNEPERLTVRRPLTGKVKRQCDLCNHFPLSFELVSGTTFLAFLSPSPSQLFDQNETPLRAELLLLLDRIGLVKLVERLRHLARCFRWVLRAVPATLSSAWAWFGLQFNSSTKPRSKVLCLPCRNLDLVGSPV